MDEHERKQTAELIRRATSGKRLIKAGDSIEANITKYLTYTVKHTGWCLNIKASRGGIIVTHEQDGSVTIGNSGPAEDDEV